MGDIKVKNIQRFGDAGQLQGEFEDGFVQLVPDYRYLDWKITPYLTPSPDSGEDVFKWKYHFDVRIGLEDGSIVGLSQLSDSCHNFLSRYAEEFGWNFLNEIKDGTPVPWDGSSFFFMLYRGHRSWISRGVTDSWNSFSFSLGLGEPRRIVGVMQVRNAELLVAKAIENAMPLLDWLVVLDNESTDSTFDIIKNISEKDPRVLPRSILITEAGGRQLHSLCGTNTVVVKIDADEIWNPQLVKRLRGFLLEKNMQNVSELCIPFGQLYVNAIDMRNRVCVGKSAKWSDMYYFGNIIAWPQLPERLHGLDKVLRDGVSDVSCEIPDSLMDDYAILHFPFLEISTQRSLNKKPGWEQHKASYVECDSTKWKAAPVDNFGMHEALENIMGNEKLWTLPREYLINREKT